MPPIEKFVTIGMLTGVATYWLGIIALMGLL